MVAGRGRIPWLLTGPLWLAVAGVVLQADLSAAAGRPTLLSLGPFLEAARTLGGWEAGHARSLAVAAAIAAGMFLLVAGRRPFRGGGETPRVAVAWVSGALLLVTVAAVATGWWLAALTAGVTLALVTVFHPLGAGLLWPSRWTTPILAAILLLAAVLRLVLIMHHAVGFGTHAAGHLQLSIDLVEHWRGGVITASQPFDAVAYVADQQGPMAVVNALGFLLFGVGFPQARLTQAVLGILVVWLAFLFGRRLVDERTGLALAFIVGISPWQVAVSRFNDAEHVLAPLQALLAAWAVLRAEQEQTPFSLVVAGLGCALGWYVYATNQALLAVLVGYLVWRLLRRRSGAGGRWRGLALFLLAFTLASLPHLCTWVHRGHYLPVRSTYETGQPGLYEVAAPRRLLNNVERAVELLWSRADDPWFSKPSGGGLDGLVVALFPAGLLWTLLEFAGGRRRGRAALLMLWAAAGVLPAVFLSHVVFRRMTLVVLLAEILAAIVLVEAARLLARAPAGRRLLVVAVPLAAILWCAADTWTYWDRVVVSESRRSSYFACVANEIRDVLGRQPVVVVLRADGDQAPEHRNAIRLGDYSRVRQLVERGQALDEALRLTPIQDVAGVLRAKLRAGLPVRVVADRDLLKRSGMEQELEGTIGRLDPDARLKLVRDQTGKPVVASWNLSPFRCPGGS